MNVTNDGFKDRQLHIEGYLQMVSAEQKEHAEVAAHQRIAENNHIITDFQKKKRRGYVQICEMETGIVVDILYCRLHLTIRNSMNLATQHSQSFI